MKYMGLGNVMLCLFQSKTLCKDNFLYFPVFGGIRINKLKEKLSLINIKCMTYFKILFFTFFFFWKNNSISQQTKQRKL